MASGKLRTTIEKQIQGDLNEININKVDNDFNNKFHITEQKSNFIARILWGTLIEAQLLDEFPTIPVFYTKTFEIYKDGHIIVGWNGKFPAQSLCLEEPITNLNGKLIIF